MRSFLLDLLRFAPFAVAGYILIVIAFGMATPPGLIPNLFFARGGFGHSPDRFADLERLPPGVDVLVLGSSHAYRGVDPRNFPDGMLFVLGSSGQTPKQTRMLVRRHLDSIRPRHVVYVVNGTTFNADGVESALDLIASDRVDAHAWQMACSMNNIKVYNTLIYANFNQWTSAFRNTPLLPEPKKDTYVTGGYVERKIQHYERRAIRPSNSPPHDGQMEAFLDVIAAVEERGIPLLLAQAPVTDARVRAFMDRNSYDSLFIATGHPYIDFQPLVELDDSLHFYDDHHMNQHGVDRFNAVLRAYLPGGERYPEAFPKTP